MDCTSLYKCAKLEFYTTPYPELALGRWMGQNAPLSISALANTSTLPSIGADKTPHCKTLEILFNLGFEYNGLSTFSHMVTVTVFLLSTHYYTAPHHLQVIAEE